MRKSSYATTFLAIGLVIACSASRADVVVVEMGGFGAGLSGVPISGVEVRLLSGSFVPPILPPPMFPTNTAVFQGTTVPVGEAHAAVIADAASSPNFGNFAGFITGPNAWLTFQFRSILADGTTPVAWDGSGGATILNFSGAGYDLVGWQLQEMRLAFTSITTSSPGSSFASFPRVSISFVGLPPSPVPEPSGLWLAVGGLALITAAMRRKNVVFGGYSREVDSEA